MTKAAAACTGGSQSHGQCFDWIASRSRRRGSLATANRYMLAYTALEHPRATRFAVFAFS